MSDTPVIHTIYKAFVDSGFQICTDSRSIQSGCVFFCLRGDHFDGNAFAVRAHEQGASAVVIDCETHKGDPRFIWVENTTTALQLLAKHHADQMSAKIIVVGGSNGKTTTKEIAKIVLERIGVTLATPGNWNNHIGVPLTLLSLREMHEFAIIEMGTNHPGEMKILCDLVRPDLGLITNIGKEHLEGFGNIESVALEESELFLCLLNHKRKGIVNIDDPWLSQMGGRLDSVLTISTKNSKADLFAEITAEMPILTFNLYHNQKLVGAFKSSLSGGFNAYNLLFGASLGIEMKLKPFEAMSLAVSYIPTNNRSEWRKIGNTQIFLDAYNANPSSMSAALRSFATLDGKKTIFLGDMLELGDHSVLEHQQLFDLVTALGLADTTHLVGTEFSRSCIEHPFIYDTVDSLLAWLDTHSVDSEFVFVKGSRGMKMERVLLHFDPRIAS